MPTETTVDLSALRARSRGPVYAPGDPGWDHARTPWQLGADQRPAAVAVPADQHDVEAVVDFARAAGLRVAPQGTGHNAVPLAPSLADAVLVKTGALGGVAVDPERRRARARAGAIWEDVAGAAARHGLAALSGSSPDVGVVGYSLGGGIGWLARRYGLQSSSLTAVELVTAGGELVRADDGSSPDLMWALRGGGGNFGVVTAVEFDLYPVDWAYAGALVWDWRHSEAVLARWSEWAPTAPDEVTTSARIMQFPPLPDVPAPLRGRNVVMIDGAVLGDHEAILRPLRELRPELDTFAAMPAAGLIRVHGDPEEPMPVVSDQGMLADLPREAVEAFVEVAGPGSGSPLMIAELRQLGGALARRAERPAALPSLAGGFVMFAGTPAPDEQSASAGLDHARRLTRAMEPWANGRAYLNFAEQPMDVGTGYEPDDYARLLEVRAEVDPDGLFLANHTIGGD
jgi:FAD/FMN-containing dehydrogenase